MFSSEFYHFLYKSYRIYIYHFGKFVVRTFLPWYHGWELTCFFLDILPHSDSGSGYQIIINSRLVRGRLISFRNFHFIISVFPFIIIIKKKGSQSLQTWIALKMNIKIKVLKQKVKRGKMLQLCCSKHWNSFECWNFYMFNVVLKATWKASLINAFYFIYLPKDHF